jgi:hypothetical protein
LDVSFRLIDDADDTQRTDRIDYSTVEEYGYDLVSEDFDIFDDIDDDEDDYQEDYLDDDVELDEEELISFLNEYYLVNPLSLPRATFF